MSAGLSVIQHAVPQSRCNAEDKFHLVLLCQLHPWLKSVFLVLGEYRGCGTVTGTGVEEKNPRDIVSPGDYAAGKASRGH